ncbi:MAG: hypothetical protein GY950_24100, partial [bacterium]|nr:hypothetical protein [bacterium]
RETPKPPPPLKHEKCFYTGKDGKLYVYRGLPIYLHISSTPGSKKSYLLGGKDTEQYANPMFLAEGLNVLKKSNAVNPKDKSIVSGLDINFEVYADGTAPVTTPVFSDTPKNVDGDNIYYGEGLVFQLTSRDNLSGVQQVYLSVNGKTFEPLEGPFTGFTGDAKNHLRYYAVDNVGNAEKPREVLFYLDTSPPRTQLRVKGDHKGNILSSRALISLPAGDDLSGVKSVRFQIDNQKERTYSENIPVDHLAEGEHRLVYFAEDFVNNIEKARTYTFYCDSSAPGLSVSISGDKYKIQNMLFVSRRSKIKMEAVDDIAGSTEIRYRIGEGEENIYSTPISLPGPRGIHRITCTMIDNVGNQAREMKKNIYLDMFP